MIDPAQVLANRDVTVTVVSGYSGPGYQFPVAGGYTIVGTDYDSGSADYGYDAETYAVEILSGNPVAGDNLTVEIAATVDCVLALGDTACAPETILLSVTFVPLSPLGQDPLNAVYDEDFEHELRIREAFRADANLSVTRVQGGDNNLFTLNVSDEIVRNADATPSAGEYVVIVEMTHGDLRGAFILSVTASISRADLNPAAYGLSAEKAYVAAGYTGDLHQNIVLPPSALEAVLELPGEFPAGMSLALAEAQRAAAVELTDAIAGEIVRNITLNVTRNDANYNDLEQVVVLTVTALGVPPLLVEERTAAAGRPFSGVLRDLAAGGAGGYEDGNYAGGFFEDRDESADLDVSQAGVVSTERGLEAGDYGITIAVNGRPSAAEANFAGSATITVQLSVTLGVVDLEEDDVVLPAARNVVLDAAAGYFGRGYKIPVEAGHTLLASAAQYEANLLDYEDGVISILETNPVETTGLTLSLVVIGDCADDTTDDCNNVPVSIVAEFQAVAVPAQPSGSAAYREGFTVPLALPAGYEQGARINRVLEVTGVEDSDGQSVDLTNISLDVNGDDLEYAPDAAQGEALDAGVYTIAVELSQTDPASATDSLLGTLTLEVEAVITPRDLDPANYGLSEPERATVTVAAGSGAIGEELARVSLSESAAGAIVVLPGTFTDSFALSLSVGGSIAVFYLTADVAGGTEIIETADLTVTLNDNHNSLAQPTGLTVSALRTPARAPASGTIPLNGAYDNANIYEFRGHPSGDYGNAVFVKSFLAGNRASLTVSAEGVVGTDTGGITLAGTHTIMVDATSPDYVGTARLELVVDLVQQGQLQSGDTIPLDERTRLQPVAPGYAGSVAFFAAGRAGVTLETPADPTDFNFGTDGANSDYAGRDGGFTLYVNEGVAAAAGDTSTALFTVRAKDAGGDFAIDSIEVAVTVSVLRTPVQADLNNVDATTNFEHALMLDGIPGGLDGETGVLDIVGVVKDGAEDGTDPFRLEGANLRPANPGGAAFGDYEVSISWSHSKFLGELTLAVDVEIAEVIDLESVVPAALRNVTVTVRAGYFGAGHKILPGADYEFVGVAYDDTAADYDDVENVIQIRADNAPTANNLELAVTATAGCLSSTGRNCARRVLTVSATFVPLQPIAQTRLTANADENFRHSVDTGAYSTADVAVTRVDGGANNLFIAEETALDSGNWEIVGNPSSLPDFGLYTIFLAMTDDGFRGVLPLAVTASIRETIDPADVVANRSPMVDAAAGYTGSAYTILVESGYLLTLESYDSNLLGYDAENKVISIVSTNPVPLSGELAVTLTAEARCEDAARDCRPEKDIEVVATFPVIDADQDTATESFKAGWTVSLKFPAGYENGAKSGRDTRILHPLPQTGDIVADAAACEALGGRNGIVSTCLGYARSLETGVLAAHAIRGDCTFSDDSGIQGLYPSCDSAFTKARECNAQNKPLVNNSTCGAVECAAETFALGGKCLALKLSADEDMLEHAPSGAADALNAGMRRIIVGMTETDLLGTALLEVGTDISRIQLDAKEFGLSAPARATITIAAGGGAVGEELARVGLTVVDEAVVAAIKGLGNDIRNKLSLEALPASGIQTVVFYLEAALDGRMTAEIVELTVESVNANYTELPQSVTLNIEALAEPKKAEESGVAGPANPYSNANVHDFKTGNSGSYANAQFVAGGRSVQLMVDKNGIVSTTEDITAGGIYRLTAYATSPDFIGTATLELRLDLAPEGEFTPGHTIPSSQRSQDVVVVPGYSGSVAFFAAQTLGVTLRTPAAAPTDFSFGTDGADRDYASPDGFTLFLDDGKINAAGETAAAAFVVTAKAAGFTTQEVTLTVNVAALTVPGRTDLTAREESADYGAVGGHARYPIGGAISASIAGVAVSAAGALTPLSDHANRVRLAGANLSPVDADEANERLAAGRYVITVEMTHAGFLGDADADGCGGHSGDAGRGSDCGGGGSSGDHHGGEGL